MITVTSDSDAAADAGGCQGNAAQRQQLNGQQEPGYLLVADTDVA